MLEFGSRSGTYVALGVCALLFGILGWAVSREIQQGSGGAPGHRRLARQTGFLLFVGPLLLTYASSFGGFYDIEVDNRVVRLGYAVPMLTTELPVADIVAVQPIPWYRGRWRLQLVTSSGRVYESANWHHVAIVDSAMRLKQVFARSNAK